MVGRNTTEMMIQKSAMGKYLILAEGGCSICHTSSLMSESVIVMFKIGVGIDTNNISVTPNAASK